MDNLPTDADILKSVNKEVDRVLKRTDDAIFARVPVSLTCVKGPKGKGPLVAGNTLAVYMALASHGTYDQKYKVIRSCYPSKGQMVITTGLSRSAIAAAYKELTSLGLMRNTRHRGMKAHYELYPHALDDLYRQQVESFRLPDLNPFALYKQCILHSSRELSFYEPSPEDVGLDDTGASPGDAGNASPGDVGLASPGDAGNASPGDAGNASPGDVGHVLDELYQTNYTRPPIRESVEIVLAESNNANATLESSVNRDSSTQPLDPETQQQPSASPNGGQLNTVDPIGGRSAIAAAGVSPKSNGKTFATNDLAARLGIK